MNFKNPTSLNKIFALLSALLFFTIIFLFTLINQLDPILNKKINHYDEIANSVVSANLTRNLFPPMLRINPFDRNLTGDWLENAYWQHIPPLFTYVPWVFFKMDGGVSIEITRFSYACLMYAAGFLLIVTVYLFDNTYLSLMAATIASIIWISLPFSAGLITGFNFGSSDIVLAFSIICSFAALCWYMRCSRQERLQYSLGSLAIISFTVALPVLTKSILGSIPCVTFSLFLLYDHKKISNQFYWACSIFLIINLLYYGALYLSSPLTFINECTVPFQHFGNYEQWGRPWHFYFSNYIPKYYFKSGLDLVFWGCILIGFYGLYAYQHTYSLRTKKILWLAISWFVLSFIVLSFVTSKSPNFIYQMILLGIFFGSYSVLLLLKERQGMVLVSLFMVFILINTAVSFVILVHNKRTSPYIYKNDDERYYHFAEIERSRGVDWNDIYVIAGLKNEMDQDRWLQYYIIFLTGAESKMLPDIEGSSISAFKEKYHKLFFVFDANVYGILKTNVFFKLHQADKFSVLEFDVKDITPKLLYDMSHIHPIGQ